MRFKSKCFVFLLVVCILFSAAAVSASDTNYMDVNTNDSNEKLELTNDKTYDNFYEDIESSTDSFDMENNYKYDESDSRMDLSINKTNLVINGNNHIRF